MGRPEDEVFQRLGPEGLARVLEDLLDRNRLVRLANSCGLKYPGMRTRSQTRDKIVSDLVERADQQATTRKAIYRLLEKETRNLYRKWSALDAQEKAGRLVDRDYLLANGNLGTHIFFLARSDPKEGDGFETLLARQSLLGLAADGSPKRTRTDRPSREETRLGKKVGELQKKILHLENQLLKSRDAEKTLKRDLIQRKGELAESRMLAERLRREVTEARAERRQAPAAKAPPPADEGLGPMAKAVRRLVSQQKKLAERIEKLPDSSAAPRNLANSAVAPLGESLETLHTAVAALRKDVRRSAKEQNRAIDEISTSLAAAPKGEAGGNATRASRSAKGSSPRVGVFIDVQNMFYGARRLKGKLDFDALLEAAVRDRRRVQATAYVVESSEIDQTGFISILQQRAIDVRRKNVRVRADGSMKGDWDMELALDILDAAPRLDVVVLVSGDGDFTSLVQRVKQMGPRVEVIGFPRTTAKSLIGAADHFQPLDRKFMIYSRATAPGRTADKAPAPNRTAPRSRTSTPKNTPSTTGTR